MRLARFSRALLLLFIVGLLSSCTIGVSGPGQPQGNGEGIAGRQAANLTNSAVRCAYKSIGKGEYVTDCVLVVMEKYGEYVASALEEGISLAWASPSLVEGAEPTSVSCDNKSFSQNCRIQYADSDDSKLKFLATLTKAVTGEKSEKDAIIQFPYSAQSYGLIPNLTTDQAPLTSQSATASEGERGLTGRTTSLQSESSTVVKAGVQTEALPSDNLAVGPPKDLCAAGGKTYFSASNTVYWNSEGQVRLFTGSAKTHAEADLSQRTRFSFDSYGSTQIACTDDGVFFTGDQKIYFASNAGPVREVGGCVIKVSGDCPQPETVNDVPVAQVDLSNILDMALGNDGSLYYVQSGRAWVRKITPEGKVFTLPLSIPVQTPVALSADASGVLWVADKGLGKVLKVILETNKASVFATANIQSDAALLGMWKNKLYLFAGTGGGAQGFVSISSDGTLTEVPNGLNLSGVARDSNTCHPPNDFYGYTPAGRITSGHVSNGKLLVAETDQCRITSMSDSGNTILMETIYPAVNYIVPPVNQDSQTALLGRISKIFFRNGVLNFFDGRLVIAQIDDASKTLTRTFFIPSFGALPEVYAGSLPNVIGSLGTYSVATESDGTMYVGSYLNMSAQRAIHRITPDGTISNVYTDNNLSNTLMVTSDHTLYGVTSVMGYTPVVDKIVNGVRSIEAGTGVAAPASSTVSYVPAPALQVVLPQLTLLTPSADGSFFAANGAAVYRFSAGPNRTVAQIAGPATSSIGFAGDGGPASSALFRGIRSIEVDHVGNVYVLDAPNSRIRVLTPNGDGTYQIKTLLGGDSRSDCSGSISTKKNDTDLNSITSSLCFSNMYSMAVDSSSCSASSETGQLQIAFGNAFSVFGTQYQNIVVVKSPCPRVP